MTERASTAGNLTHFCTGERRDDGDVVRRRQAFDDSLQDEFAARLAEIDLDIRLVVAHVLQLALHEGRRLAGDALRRGQRGAPRSGVREARILILDEPTSALDLKNQVMVLEWIGALSRKNGLTIIMTTHHPHHALAVADDAFLMMGETQSVVGPASQVLTEENLTKLYGSAMSYVGFSVTG